MTFSWKYCYFSRASSYSSMQCILNFGSMLLYNTLYTITFIFVPCATWHSYWCMQGFLDGYHFSGNIQNRHKQIGNAVPPPLAYVLGLKLKEAVDAKSSSAWPSHGCLWSSRGAMTPTLDLRNCLYLYKRQLSFLRYTNSSHQLHGVLPSILESILSGFMFSRIDGSQVMAVFAVYSGCYGNQWGQALLHVTWVLWVWNMESAFPHTV